MGGKDDDPRSDLERWVDASHAEMERLRRQVMDDLHRPSSSSSVSSGQQVESSESRNRSTPEWFKDLVDRSLNTLSESFRNFPSNISELKARMQQEVEARREEERDIWRRWTGSDDSPDHVKMQVERASREDRENQVEATKMLLREAMYRNANVPISKIIDLYSDAGHRFPGLDEFAAPMLSFGGACYYKPETVENLPSTARWGWPAPKQRWLGVEWFKRDPYSPIRLEAHPDLEKAGPKWRLAFEDLLNASMDKPMDACEKVGQKIPYGRPQSTLRGPGLDWMLSLQCRGILPPQLPSTWRNFPAFDKSELLRDHQEVLGSMINRLGHGMSNFRATEDDFKDLHDEIAIRAGPATEAAPFEQGYFFAEQQSPWQVPETEEELYEQMWPHADSPKTSDAATFRIERDLEACDACYGAVISWALKKRDTEMLIHALSVYRSQLGTIPSPPDDDSLPFFVEALFQLDTTQEEHDFLMASVPVKGSSRTIREAFDALSRMDQASVDVPAQQPKPDILSQLTTTETTRAPDGTVTTKVVLKQRFADGREETRESVHTSREDPTRPAMDEMGKQAAEKPKQKGWFWS